MGCSVNQQSLPLRLKATGLDAVEHTNLTWVEEMRHFARWVCEVKGSASADDVRGHARAIHWKPDSPNAYGAVFRGKHWKCVGRKKSEAPSNYAREIRVWRWI